MVRRVCEVQRSISLKLLRRGFTRGPKIEKMRNYQILRFIDAITRLEPSQEKIAKYQGRVFVKSYNR